jgi:hypothetical protein
LTSRNQNPSQKTPSFNFSEIHSISNSEIFHDEHPDEFNSELGHTLKNIRLSTLNDMSDLDEKEHMYLCSNFSNSFEFDKNSIATFDLNNNIEVEGKTQNLIPKEGDSSKLEKNSEGEEGNESILSSHSSQDIYNDPKFGQNLKLNRADIDVMSKQLKELLLMVKSGK